MLEKSFYFAPPENKRPLMPITDTYSRRYPMQTNSRPSRTIPVQFPCYSCTIKPTMSRERAENKQRTSMTYQSTILENFC